MKDLTKGKPLPLILSFAVPIGIGLLFQLMYSLVDTRIVGSVLGEQALAAVGATNSLNNMLIGFLNGLTNGFAIIAARYFGAREYGQLRKTVGCTFGLAIIISGGIVGVSSIALHEVLVFLNTPENLIPISQAYFQIILAGMIFAALYNACAALLRAIGDSVTPLIFLIISACLNIGLDLLFVCVFDLGVQGAAIATLLSQSLAVIACFIYLWKRYEILHFSLEDMKIWKKKNRIISRTLLVTGGSMGFMSSFISLGSVALQGAINSLENEAIIVAHTAARKVTEIFMLPFSIFGQAMATYSGQNYGADKPKRVRLGLRQVLLLLAAWDTIDILMAYTIAPWLIRLVTGTNMEEIIHTAVMYLKVNVLLYYVPSCICVIRQVLQGIGDSVTPIISSSVELFSKIAFAALLAPIWGYWAIIWSEPVAWVLMVIPLIIQYYRNPFISGKGYGRMEKNGSKA